MPYASYLAIRKMIAKRHARLGSVIPHFELVIIIFLAALIVWISLRFSQ
jgi:hypothetical protein